MPSKTTYTSPLCSCVVCKQTKSAKAIHSHFISAHTELGNQRVRQALSSVAAKTGRESSIISTRSFREMEYGQHPSVCKYCGVVLTYNNRQKTFCSHSCSTKFHNAARVATGFTLSAEARKKISEKLKQKNPKAPQPVKVKHKQSIQSKLKKATKDSTLPFSSVRKCRCKVCSKVFFNKTQSKFCKLCKSHHSSVRAEFRFRFNVFDFPELFDLKLLAEVGFYAPGGKSGKWNPNGLSRDHKVSVSDAIANNFDPFYISHPCNCELMAHHKNNKKKTNSSISYQYLVQLVDQFERVKSGAVWS